MMTTVSIDTYNAASALSGEAASCRLSEVGASFTSGGTPLPQSEAVVLFQSSLAEQAGENAALDADLRTAMVSVSETLSKVAVASGQETVAVPAVREPLPEQVAVNVALDSEITAVTSGLREALKRVAALSGQETVAVPAVRESLPEQVSSNSALGVALQESLALGEAASRRLSEDAGSIDKRQDAASPMQGLVASDKRQDVASPMQELVSSDDETDSAPSAEVLVAAGVAPAAVPSVAVVDAPAAAPVVAPVDVARIQSTEAVSSAVLVQAAEAVADTLLVTPGLLRGQGEVIVQLRPDVLEGTEVKISVTGRQLDVVFQPQSVDMAVLIENCRSQLVQHLAAKIVSFNVSVDVRKKRA